MQKRDAIERGICRAWFIIIQGVSSFVQRRRQMERARSPLQNGGRRRRYSGLKAPTVPTELDRCEDSSAWECCRRVANLSRSSAQSVFHLRMLWIRAGSTSSEM